MLRLLLLVTPDKFLSTQSLQSQPGLAGTKKGDGTFTTAALFNEGGI